MHRRLRARPGGGPGTPRPGRFDDQARARLNRRLLRLGAVDGEHLPPTDRPADPAFVGLFPSLVSDTGECPCGCGDRPEDDDPPPPLPMLRPEEPQCLAELAAASPLVSRAVALASWLGDGFALTPSHVLRPADALRAVAELDLARPLLPPDDGAEPDAAPVDTGSDSRPDDTGEEWTLPVLTGAKEQADAPRRKGRSLRSAKDLPQLHEVWSACLAAGLIEIRADRAYPGPGVAVWLDPADAPDRIENWCTMVAGALRARDDSALAGRDRASVLRREILHLAVPLLYTMAHEAILLGALGVALTELVDEDDLLGTARVDLLSMVMVEVRRTVEEWLAAGVLEPAALDPEMLDGLARHLADLPDSLADLPEEEVEGEARRRVAEWLAGMTRGLLDGPAVRLTPLGRYGLARILTAHEWPVPHAGERRFDEPEALLDHLFDYLPDDAVEEVVDWIAARGEAWEPALLRVIRSAGGKGEEGPGRREMLTLVLAAAGQRVTTVMDAVGDDPWLDPVLAMVRFELGVGKEPSLRHMLWLAVDTLSVLLDDPDAFADDVVDSPLQELLSAPEALATALALDRPATREVLRAAAAHLDDQGLVRALRKALSGRSGNPALRAGGKRPAKNKRT